MHVADGGLGETPAPASLRVTRQPADAVAYQTTMQRAAAELRQSFAQAAEHVVERQLLGAHPAFERTAFDSRSLPMLGSTTGESPWTGR